jgi:hypothetical protein
LAARGVYFAPLRYWIDALGIIPLFSLVLCWFFVNREFMRLYIPSVFVWAYVNYHGLQPYIRQNVIAFYPLWVSLAAIAMVLVIQKVCRKAKNEELKGVLIGLSILAFAVSVWSALLGYGRLWNQSKELWSGETEAVGAWIAANTPRKAVFISCPSGFSPVSTVAGKVLYRHTDRVEWQLGYSVGQRAEEIRKLIANLENPEIAPKVTYILIEKGKCPELIPRDYQGTAWETVFRSDNFSIMARKPPPKQQSQN